jgi:hypothetical protein
MRLTQEGSALSGTMESPMGTIPVSGTIEGARVTLRASLPAGGQQIPLVFAGEATADSMSGTLETPMGSFDWSAQRIEGEARR